jgi:Mn-dependent DtxR family transcriptional regulator
MPSHTEENYLKTIYKLAEAEPGQDVSTNRIAAALATRAASVTDMLRRLAEKELLEYEKYRGVRLTPEGRRLALLTVRKHRLWYFWCSSLALPGMRCMMWRKSSSTYSRRCSCAGSMPF